MSIQVGQEAPDFTLYNTDKEAVSLSSLKGKPVVLLFFPLAFTGVCTKELCSVRDDIASYSGLDATVLGISVDSPMVLAKFREEQNLPFQLLSDFNKEVAGTYGAQYEEFVLGMKGVAKRSAFVVDADGKIVYAEVLDNAGEIPNFDAVKASLS